MNERKKESEKKERKQETRERETKRKIHVEQQVIEEYDVRSKEE